MYFCLGEAKMKIDIVEYIKEFEAIRDDWNRVYLSDPESNPFLSWSWLHEYLSCRDRWFILALKHQDDSARYDALLPLELTTCEDEESGLFCDELRLIGNGGTGHAGFLSKPGGANEAADAFGRFFLAEDWASIRFDCCCPLSGRLKRLIDAFPDETFVHVSPDEPARPGADGRPLRSMFVKTRTGRNLHDRLNRRSVELVFERATTLHVQGDLDRAEAGYRQVIRTVPGHVHARYGLARLLSDRDDNAEAEYLYRGLAAAVPDDDDIRHRLGDAQIAQGSYREASATFGDLLARQPHLGIVRYKLAVTLLAAGRKDTAIAVFQSFDNVASDDADHVRCKLKAREILTRLHVASHLEKEETALRPACLEPDDGAPSVRFLTATPLLLQPSLPGGAWARLHAGPSPYDGRGSRLKH